MNIFDFMQALVKHGGYKFTPPDQLTSSLELPMPKEIYYAETLKRNEKGEILCKKIAREDFNKIITKNQKEIPYAFEETAYVKKENIKKKKNKENKPSDFDPKEYLIMPDELSEKVAVIGNEKVGCGLYVIAKEGLRKGTRILYSGITHPDNDNLLYRNCGYICASEDLPVDNALHKGGFGRFVQAVPPKAMLKEKDFKNYKSNSKDFDISKIATANVDMGTLKFTSSLTNKKEEVSYYEITEDVPYGSQILADWGDGYMDSANAFMPYEFGIFNKQGDLINPGNYEPPMKICAWPGTGYYNFVPVELYEQCIRENKNYRLQNPDDSRQTYDISPQEMQEILDYYKKDKIYIEALNKEILRMEDWQKLFPSSQLKPKSKLMENHLINGLLKEKVENPLAKNEEIPLRDYVAQVCIKAYQNKDFQTAIKLSTWLVIQEFRKTSPLDIPHLINSFWNLGNAYRWAGYYDEAVLLVQKAKQFDQPINNQKYDKRIEEIRDDQIKWQEQQNKKSESESTAKDNLKSCM